MRIWMFIGGIVALLAVLAWQYPHVLGNGDNAARILRMLMWLVLIATGAGMARHLARGKGMRDAALWLGIIMALVLGYSYKNDIKGTRLFGALVPGSVQVTGEGALQIRASHGGHFFIETHINGAPERFMIDTGATDIALSPRAATAAGFDIETLGYTRVYSTANGTVSGAPVRIKRLEVGRYTLRNVPASVNKAPMKHSLMGMTFLNQFESYNVEGDIMTLYPRKR